MERHTAPWALSSNLTKKTKIGEPIGQLLGWTEEGQWDSGTRIYKAIYKGFSKTLHGYARMTIFHALFYLGIMHAN